MNEQVRTQLDSRSASDNKHRSPLLDLCDCTPDEAVTRLDTVRTGLTSEQVDERLEKYGPNEITHEKPPTWYVQLFHAFVTPFNGVLFAVSIVSLFTDVIFAAPEDRTFRTIIVLTTMVLLSTLLRFWQEFRSNKAAEELKAMVSSTTAVLRAGMQRPQEIPISTLVPGDIVYLSAGDMIPADVRLLSCKDLFLSQGSLTGESFPVEKFAAREDAVGRSPLELTNVCYLGTSVESGAGTAVVLATGLKTFLGGMSTAIEEPQEATSFDRGDEQIHLVDDLLHPGHGSPGLRHQRADQG